MNQGNNKDLDKLRSYYINTKNGFVGKETAEGKTQYVMESYKALLFHSAYDAIKFANTMVMNGSVQYTHTPPSHSQVQLLAQLFLESFVDSFGGRV